MNKGGAWRGWEGASPLVRFAAISVAVILVATTVAAIVLPGNWAFAAILFGLFLLGYVPVTPFALRAKIGNGVLRYLFGLTAVPLFMVLFVWILHRLFTELPQLDAAYAAERSAGGRMPGMGYGAMITALTAIVFGAWYGLLRLLDHAIRALAAPAANAVASLIAVAVLSGAVFLAYDGGLIGSRVAHVAQRAPGGAHPSGDWMSANELQREFDHWKPEAYYPQRIEGKCERGALHYRADWKIIERGRRYSFHYGASRETFERHAGEMRAQGYALDSTSVFKGCGGEERFQGTWTRSAPRL
jgi:hypothetical protein